MNWKKKGGARKTGSAGEDAAARFLQRNGYAVLETNFYYDHGEIDIVAKEGNTLVFVEVKSRRSGRFGAPEESVTPRKQELLRRTAEGYVLSKNLGAVECRFDVVSVMMNGGKTECRVLKNCF